MKRFLFVFALTLCSLNSFAQSNPIQTSSVQQTPSLEIFVNEKGKIYVDGKKVSITELDQQLADLKKNNGFVKFAKEKITKKSAYEKLTEATKLFSKYQRVVKLYTDKTFTKEHLF
jgi:biopolymer transport protein ExbD